MMDHRTLFPPVLNTIAHFIVERPGPVALLWLLIIIFAIPSALKINDRLVVAGVVEGVQATAVDRALATEFKDMSQNVLLLVIAGVGDEHGQLNDLMSKAIYQIGALDFVNRTAWRNPARSTTTPVASPDSSYVIVHLGASVDAMHALRLLRTFTDGKLPEIRLTYPSAELQWTGESAIREAIITSSNKDLRSSELRAFPLVFLLLLFAFRSFVAALMPLLFGAFSILLTLALASILAQYVTLSIMLQSVATLLGLALGTDYALLMINRFRETLPTCENSRQAALITLRKGGKTVVISGSAVAIGFAGLTLVPVDQMRSIAYAGLLVSLFSVMLATTLMPAILALFGPGIEFGTFRSPLNRFDFSSGWGRWARFVCRRPMIVLVISSVPLFALALSSQQMSSSFPEESWLPAHTEPVKALRKIEQMDNGNIVKRLKILYRLPEGISALDGDGTQALKNLHRHIIRDERSRRVQSILTFAGSSLSLRSLTGKVPDEILNHYVSADRSLALLELIPNSTLDQQQLSVLVEELRNMNVQDVTGLAGIIQVGGLPAAAVDYERVIQYWFPWVILVVALGSFMALAVAFRSLLIPLKAVILNLLAVFASYGALVLVFVEGYGANILGLAEPIQAVFPATPVLVFCAAFGISMDYEVFLLSRIAEARRNNLDEATAIVEGLTKTGRLITSAAAIMVTVFGAFAFGNVLPTQILGFALAMVVALDAIFIRMALGPAFIRLAGRFNWWPGS